MNSTQERPGLDLSEDNEGVLCVRTLAEAEKRHSKVIERMVKAYGLSMFTLLLLDINGHMPEHAIWNIVEGSSIPALLYTTLQHAIRDTIRVHLRHLEKTPNYLRVIMLSTIRKYPLLETEIVDLARQHHVDLTPAGSERS